MKFFYLLSAALKYVKKKEVFLILPILLTLLFLTPLSLSKTHIVHANIAYAVDITGWITEKFWQEMSALTDHLLTFFLLITKLASSFFTAAADYSTRGTLYANLSFINTVWIFIRDLVNSTFIFIVLYVAIKGLLDFDSPNTTTIKKTLLHIIIAALLINFSLFFTKVTIDASNYLTRSLFCRMQTKDESKDKNNPIITCDPGSVLLKGMRFESIADTGKLQAEAASEAALSKIKTNEFAAKTLVNLLGVIVAIIAAISFFATAFMFIARIFILVLIMATSPIYFAAKVLDNKQVQAWKAQWEKMLTSQLVFPVVFMGILYIGVLFTQTAGFIPDGSTFGYASLFVGNTTVALPIILNFGFLIAILLFGLKTARNMGGQAEVMGNKMSNFVTNRTLGMAGALGRQTVGRAATGIANSDMAKKWATSENKYARMVGDKVIRGGKAVGGSSMDLRNSKAFGAVASNVGGEFGMKMNKGSDKSFTKDGREFGEMGPQFIRNGKTGTLFGMKVSDDAKKRLAEEEKATIDKRSYSGTAMARDAANRLGDRIMDKEHKGTRDQIVKALQDEYKNKKSPEDKAELALKLQKTFGKDASGKPIFATDDEFKELRTELTKDIRKANKDAPKDAERDLKAAFGDAYDGKEFNSVRAEIGKEKTKAEFKEDSDKIKEAEGKVERLKKDPATLPADITTAEGELSTAKTTLVTNFEAAKKASKVDPVIVSELAIGDIDTLHGQLTKAHLQAIVSKARKEEGGYSDEDKNKLNKIIEKMLIDEGNTNPAVREWLSKEIEKETSPFTVNMTDVFDAELTKFNSGTLSAPDAEKAKKNAFRALNAMTSEELLKIPYTKLDDEVVCNLKPPALLEYRRAAESNGDTAAVTHLEKLAHSIHTGSAYPSVVGMNKERRGKTVAALQGRSFKGSGGGGNP